MGQNGEVPRSAPYSFLLVTILLRLFFIFQMVRDYKRKTDRQSWSYESMNNAVDAVISGQFGYKKSSQQFNVPQSTLERYVKKRKKTLTIKLINQQENFKKYLVMSRNKS